MPKISYIMSCCLLAISVSLAEEPKAVTLIRNVSVPILNKDGKRIASAQLTKNSIVAVIKSDPENDRLTIKSGSKVYSIRISDTDYNDLKEKIEREKEDIEANRKVQNEFSEQNETDDSSNTENNQESLEDKNIKARVSSEISRCVEDLSRHTWDVSGKNDWKLIYGKNLYRGSGIECFDYAWLETNIKGFKKYLKIHFNTVSGSLKIYIDDNIAYAVDRSLGIWSRSTYENGKETYREQSVQRDFNKNNELWFYEDFEIPSGEHKIKIEYSGRHCRIDSISFPSTSLHKDSKTQRSVLSH